nr:UbiA-like protein EboC [Rhabdobacter roseus]
MKPYLQLTRPANLVTAVADILAGMAIAGFLFAQSTPYWLLLATLGLYGGGVVLNDVFDAELDAIERPERPIPSGQVPRRSAALLGWSLLLVGVLAASLHSPLSAGLALAVALLAVLYDRFAKHHRVLGPVVMGTCRGGNLLLGMSAVPESLGRWGWLALVPIVYIGAITLISQDEVHGGKRRTLYFAWVLYGLVHLVQLVVSFQKGNLLLALPLILAHAILVGRPLWRAVQNPVGPQIGKAVKAGVLALIVMNAAWCMVFGYGYLTLVVVLLLPLSILLARIFAVT